MTPKEKSRAILEHSREVEAAAEAGAPEPTSRSTRGSASTSRATSPAAAAKRAASRSAYSYVVQPVDMCCRHIIEWCCSAESTIGSERFNNTTTNCVTTRITEEIDATSDEGLQYAKNKYSKLKVLPTTIFASMPYTETVRHGTQIMPTTSGQKRSRITSSYSISCGRTFASSLSIAIHQLPPS
jgi:hypothetical protein